MSITSEMMSEVLSLPARERYELAQRLLDSVDDSAADELDEQFIAELKRRREEMMRGEETVSDWRGSLSAIEASLSKGNGH